jgi:EmrB/QacA subfamily drug resistance transporter
MYHNNTKGIILTTTLTSFFNPFLGAAVNIALPSISAELETNTESMSWIAMSYLLSSLVFLIPFGKLTDIHGRKKIFLYGNIVLGLGSLLCSLASSILSLIAFRIIQGVGSAMIFSSSMAIITSAIPPEKRGRAIGFNVSAVYLGLTCSPLIGGILTHILGWRSLFYLNSITEFIIILSIIFYINEESTTLNNDRFDYKGALVYMISMVLMIYGFSKLPETFAIMLTCAGFIGMILFVLFELKIEIPLFELSLFFKNRVFAFSNLAALINYAATFAITFILSLYLQFIKGYTPSKSGFLLMFQPAVMTIVASFSGKLSDKYDAGIISSIGMSINVIGLLFLIFVTSIDNNIYLIMSLMILGLGFGLFSSPNTNAIMGSVDKRQLGIASATVSTMRILGQVFSMATAAMLLHMFLGSKKITLNNYAQFNESMRILFIVFTFLCFLGVFASLARRKTQ